MNLITPFYVIANIKASREHGELPTHGVWHDSDGQRFEEDGALFFHCNPANVDPAVETRWLNGFEHGDAAYLTWLYHETCCLHVDANRVGYLIYPDDQGAVGTIKRIGTFRKVPPAVTGSGEDYTCVYSVDGPYFFQVS